MSRLIWKLLTLSNQRGQSMVEYALILVLIAAVVIFVLTAMGSTIQAKFTQIEAGLSGSGS
jgi:pilus assembly protein Flp/PilA